MKRNFLLSIGAFVLSCAVVVTAFALYRQDATQKEITINFGEIIELSFSDITGGEKVLNPSEGNDSGSFTLKLGKNTTNGSSSNNSLYGKFYVELNQTKSDPAAKYLADELIIGATVNGNAYTHADIVKTGSEAPNGFVCKLTDIPESPVVITYSLSDTAKENFADYAEQSVTLKLYWVFFEMPTNLTIVAPFTEGTYYYELWTDDEDPSSSGSFTASKTIVVYKNVTYIRIYDDYGFDTGRYSLTLTEENATVSVDSSGTVTFTQS